ncbi:MAG: AAA family ATPase [Dehalococcoidia bacterium]|jgi:MoxR-like ATPase|nr:AAA family ATPase [Dehalococcoidia bacterium]|tara:strand:- start:318 stop:1337 length:1020 start_codon:yes stop_codon:yes gene_type:complete
MTTTQTGDQMHADDVAAIDELRQSYQQMCEELGKVIVGQQSVIEQLAICLFARGHALLMGVPGLAKTLLISRVAETMDLGFSRIQFTPDLMPMDITGTDILQETGNGRREFEFAKGPMFANIVLADEINRAPSKTQASMLEAMQEHRVTIVGRTYTLEEPFFVLATQNPIEQEGTYPLPEAQLDRFMFMIEVNYPELDEEIAIARLTTGGPPPKLKHIINGQRVETFQDLVRRVPVPDHIYEFSAHLVRRTRPSGPEAPEWTKALISWGAGPRAVQYLILGAKSRAALLGSYMVRLEDVVAVAEPVLMHRVITSFGAESEGINSRQIVRRLIEEIEAEG